MKLLVTILLFLSALSAAVLAVTPSVPQVINYQGRLTDVAGTPLSDGSHSVRFIIWYDSTSTNPLYIEWDSGPMTVTTDKGIFSVRLGAPPQPALTPSNMVDSLRFLGITVGADPEISPRTRLTSVPYAFTASSAVTAQTAGTAYTLVPSSMPAGGTISVGLASITSTTPVALGQFTVTAPGPGYLVVNASGTMFYDADATSASALTTFFELGLCTDPGASGTCNGTWESYFVQDADNSTGNNATPAYSMNETFAVPSAGAYTYYINGACSSASYTLNSWSPCHVNVVFVPIGLSITSPTPYNPGAEPPKQP